MLKKNDKVELLKKLQNWAQTHGKQVAIMDLMQFCKEHSAADDAVEETPEPMDPSLLKKLLQKCGTDVPPHCGPDLWRLSRSLLRQTYNQVT